MASEKSKIRDRQKRETTKKQKRNMKGGIVPDEVEPQKNTIRD